VETPQRISQQWDNQVSEPPAPGPVRRQIFGDDCQEDGTFLSKHLTLSIQHDALDQAQRG
jgi:hypothetical protein